MGENHSVLTPLQRFGFVFHPGKASACYGQYSHTPVGCPPERVPPTAPAQPPAAGPAPSITNSVPAPTALPPDSGRQIPPDADRQGFVGYPGAPSQLHEPGCGDWPDGGLGSGGLRDRDWAVLLQRRRPTERLICRDRGPSADGSRFRCDKLRGRSASKRGCFQPYRACPGVRAGDTLAFHPG